MDSQHQRSPPPQSTAAPSGLGMEGWEPSTTTCSKPFLSLPRFRIEAVVITAIMVVIFTFEVSAASVAVFDSQSVSSTSGAFTRVTIYHQSISLCVSPSVTSSTTAFRAAGAMSMCQTSPLTTRLCQAMSSRVSAAGGFAIAAIFMSIIGFVNGVFEVRGRAFLTPMMTYLIALVTWVMLFFHFVLDSAAFEENLCNGASLKSLGFVYKAGWVLGFVAWLLLTVGVIFYAIQRRVRPFEYKFSEN